MTVKSTVPARIDRLPWSPFFTKMVIALGVAWVLDGLEITVAGVAAGVLSQKDTLSMSSGAVGDIATWYLLGEVVGALVFGRLSDRLGRRNLFMVTLGIYLVGSGLTAFTWSGHGSGLVFLYATRIIAGIGIGGEYAAINSAIDEMMPAKYRGRVDIAVNGTYWAGAFLATILQLIVLNNLSDDVAWRLCFLLGPVLGAVILFVRRNLPESPRWLMMHGREEEAEATIGQIERWVADSGHQLEDVPESKAIEIQPDPGVGYLALSKVLFTQMPSRSVLGASLMITQSFLYNAIFFTYALVLTKVYGVSSGNLPYYFIAFAIGNLAGPLLLGHLFDTVGRRKMISGTYILSGVLLVITAAMFKAGSLNATTQTICWSVIFFFASAGASAAYLTVSEIFPIEVRAKSIAIFFAIAQCFGSLGPHIYGRLIGDGTDHTKLFWGYMLGAAVMIVGGVIAAFLAVDAEGKSLEEVATPLGFVRKVTEAAGMATPDGAATPRGFAKG
nr:MFS transporter [Motilibacter rhizosphaerae]